MVNKEEINCLDSLCWLSSEEISKHQRILSNKLLILVNLAAFSCLDSLFWLPLEKSILGNILAHWENNPEIWEHILPIENIELEFSCLDSLCWLPTEERGRYSGSKQTAGHKIIAFRLNAIITINNIIIIVVVVVVVVVFVMFIIYLSVIY